MRAAWQLLRESPPGYGGVERVAHELANAWHLQGRPSVVFSLRSASAEPDPLQVLYTRIEIPHWALGRLLIPLPCPALLRLLTGPEPLHAHLPCPAVLLLALLARILRPTRAVSLHWHSFLERAPTPAGRWYGTYQWIAQRVLPLFSPIITTSPVLQVELLAVGAPRSSVKVLPCCLPIEAERYPLLFRSQTPSHFRVICIGRLDSYKRVDRLIEAVAAAQRQLAGEAKPLWLDVVGDGPNRTHLNQLAERLLPGSHQFHGRLNETAKWVLLQQSDLLVLPADRCHEAFGIVQLEAMCQGIPALAFPVPRSGMAWVSELPSLKARCRWENLPDLLVQLSTDHVLLRQLRKEAQERYCNTFRRAVWQQTFEEVFNR